MSSAMLMTVSPSRTICIFFCHSSDAEDIPKGSLVHLYRPQGVDIVVMREDRRVSGMFRNASFTSMIVMYLTLCSLCKFSSRVGMMYFGRRMALLSVWDGSE